MPSKDQNVNKHRGRIQAQGGGLEKSVSWSQDKPLSAKQGLSLLSRLVNKLTKKERADREKPIKRTERFINTAGKSGGVFAPIFRSFMAKGSKDKRIDIEVRSGRAFTNDND
jgi:hypothetical protein